MTEKELLGLVRIYRDCYLLPVFWWYPGTCYDQKESTWVNFAFTGAFTIYLCLGGTWVPAMTEKDLLGLTKIAKSCFGDFVSYLCLNGTWVFISAENRLENGFDKFLLFWGPAARFDNFRQFGC